VCDISFADKTVKLDLSFAVKFCFVFVV